MAEIVACIGNNRDRLIDAMRSVDPRCALERERAAAVGHHFPDYVRTMCGLCVDYVWTMIRAAHWSASAPPRSATTSRTMCGLCVDYVWTMIRAAHWSASAPPRSATTSRTMCGLCVDYVWTMIRAAHWSASAPPRSATTSRTMCGL